MTDLPRYWTPAFIEAFVERLNEDPGFQHHARRFSSKIVLQCLDTPDGRDIRATYDIDAGYVSVDVVDEDAPSAVVRNGRFDSRSALARATAPYDVWRRVDDGSLSILGAMASPEYRIEGSRMRIMLHLSIFDAQGQVASAMPKRY
jgi:hypothetical protein